MPCAQWLVLGQAFGRYKSMNDETWLLIKNERAGLKEMIRSLNINNAYALYLDHITGSIDAGNTPI